MASQRPGLPPRSLGIHDHRQQSVDRPRLKPERKHPPRVEAIFFIPVLFFFFFFDDTWHDVREKARLSQFSKKKLLFRNVAANTRSISEN